MTTEPKWLDTVLDSIINNSTSRNPLETATASSLPKTILLSTTATSAVVTSNHHPISTSSEDHVIPPLTSSPSSSFASMSAERTSAAAIVQHSKSLTKSSFGAHSHRHHHHHQQPSVDWSSASAKSSTSTAISPSFRSKSVSTSSTSSSGCGEDLDQLVNSPEGDHSGDHDHHHHHHHDSSPDSPDSGVSSSANSADDLKNNEGDEEEEEVTMHQHQREASSVEVASAVNSRSASLRSSHHCSSVSNTSLTISSAVVQARQIVVQQTVSTVSSLKVTKKSSSTSSVEASNSSVEVSELKAAIQVEAACKWHKCDWPGSYEELEDHIQDLHITLQPYYDENGKVIRWTKPPKRSAQLRANFAAATGADETDETPCNSEPEADGSDDEQAGQSDDDDRSMSSASSMRITRRTGRLLADYSASGSSKQQQHQQKMTRQQSLGNNNNNSSSAKDSKQTSSSGMEFVCLWKGCRVYGVQSSKQWLERHVREYHMGPNLHKCILAGCTRRFKTQNALQKHLETAHFSNQSGSGTGNGGGGSGLNQQHHPEHHHHHHHHNFYHLQQHHNFDQLYSIFGEGSRAQHAKQKICCACACHAKCMCFICDSEHAPSATTTSTVTPTTTVNHHPAEQQQQQQQKEKEQQRSLRHRPSTTVRDGQPLKNRCESTDSAISLNSHASSATAEHCLPPSTSTSTSISSLSSSSSAASSSSSCSSEHQQHSTNCCKQYAEFGPNAAFLKNRKKLLKRKKFFTPLPKPNIKFDFFGDQAAAMAIYAARRRRMQAAGIKYIYRMMERTEDGTFVEANLKTALKVKSSSEKDEYKEYMSEDSSNDSDVGSSDEEREEKKVKNEPEKKRRIYYCMDERLFSEYITFTTKIIGTKKSSSGETKLQLQWHPKGFYEDEWIKKCDLEFYRSRTVPRSVLPKSFLQALDEAQSSASQAAASVINGKSTVSKNTANKNIIKAKNLGSNKSTAKRSHSLNRNGRTAALGAEESESDDGAAANTAASPPQRPKRLRRQP